jgi:hypothetical protein
MGDRHAVDGALVDSFLMSSDGPFAERSVSHC